MKSAPPPPPEVIDPRWLLKAAAIVVLAALLCAYLTLCLLFYQGQWQLILHPSPSQTPFTFPGSQPIRFDAAESGTPRLSGALLPAAPGSRYDTYTILYLRDGTSSLAQSSEDARNLTILHALGLNIFAFDYRGFGQSDPTHPTQTRMTEDSNAALRYLRDTRSIPESHIVPFGTGLGTSLAGTLTAAHPAIPVAIFEPPSQSPLTEALADPRTRLLPVRILFHETFPLTPLSTLPTPKLLILSTAVRTNQDRLPPIATPKFTLALPPTDTPNLSTAIARFLDQYLP